MNNNVWKGKKEKGADVLKSQTGGIKLMLAFGMLLMVLAGVVVAALFIPEMRQLWYDFVNSVIERLSR